MLPAYLYELAYLAQKVTDLHMVKLRPSTDATKVSALRTLMLDISSNIARLDSFLRQTEINVNQKESEQAVEYLN